jgi:hypothetical protein
MQCCDCDGTGREIRWRPIAELAREFAAQMIGPN